ncbi:hypothetical protein DIPPA_23517 [Diplonema papillatum]|nr:hypothetical protein DIPPA_23517 [Diplonema papillatum]
MRKAEPEGPASAPRQAKRENVVLVLPEAAEGERGPATSTSTSAAKIGKTAPTPAKKRQSDSAAEPVTKRRKGRIVGACHRRGPGGAGWARCVRAGEASAVVAEIGASSSCAQRGCGRGRGGARRGSLPACWRGGALRGRFRRPPSPATAGRCPRWGRRAPLPACEAVALAATATAAAAATATACAAACAAATSAAAAATVSATVVSAAPAAAAAATAAAAMTTATPVATAAVAASTTPVMPPSAARVGVRAGPASRQPMRPAALNAQAVVRAVVHLAALVNYKAVVDQ